MWSAHKFIRWFAPEKQLKTLALSLLIYYALMLKELIWVVFVNVSQYKFEDLWNIAVAPLAGAWIEICIWCDRLHECESLPSRERGLKFSYHLYYLHGIGRSLRGSVDWNIATPLSVNTFQRRSLRGSVDWNVTIYSPHSCLHMSLPSRERGLKFDQS